MEAMDTYCCPMRDKIRGQHIMSKGYCIKSWALPGREDAHGTSSTNGTGLCCILQWQHLAHPPSAPLQPAELLLFYTMKLEAGKGQGKKMYCCCAVYPLFSLGNSVLNNQCYLLIPHLQQYHAPSLYLRDFHTLFWGQSMQIIFPAGSPMPREEHWLLETFSH